MKLDMFSSERSTDQYRQSRAQTLMILYRLYKAFEDKPAQGLVSDVQRFRTGSAFSKIGEVLEKHPQIREKLSAHLKSDAAEEKTVIDLSNDRLKNLVEAFTELKQWYLHLCCYAEAAQAFVSHGYPAICDQIDQQINQKTLNSGVLQDDSFYTQAGTDKADHRFNVAFEQELEAYLDLRDHTEEILAHGNCIYRQVVEESRRLLTQLRTDQSKASGPAAKSTAKKRKPLAPGV